MSINDLALLLGSFFFLQTMYFYTLNTLRKKPSTFLGTTVMATVVVGAIALGVWFCRAFIEKVLSTPHTIAGVTISPYGHKMDGLLTHSFDSVRVSVDGTEIKVVNPLLDVTILGDNRGASLNLDSVDAFVQLPDNAAAQKVGNAPEGNPAVPEKLSFPIPLKVGIGQANVKLSNDMHWEVSGLNIQSQGEKAARVKLDKVTGDYVTSPASIAIEADFASSELVAKAKIKTAKDSLVVQAKAPKNNLAVVKTKTNLTVSSPEDWLPFEIPEALPGIGKLNVQADVELDAKKKSTKYNATIQTRVGALWPLEPENITIKLNGNQNNFSTDILMENDEGGSIHLRGDFDKNLDGTFEAQVENMNAMFGPQMMPLDLEIPSAEKIGNRINANIETRQGSFFDAQLDFEDSLMITFVADISPYEPWALDWTHGNLVLRKTKFYGSFDMHKLRILAKFDTVPYVYHITADSMQVMLALDTKGIDFSNGIIYTPSETYDFDGDVKWDDPHPHTSWNLTQRHGGKASAYIGIGDTITLDVKADKAVIATVPFADIKISEKINGKVTGEWHQDFDNNIGKAEVSIDGELDAFNVSTDLVARQNGDTIFVDKLNAAHNKNSVEANAAFIIPNDSNPDFKPTSFLPIQVLHAWISSKEFSIPLLLEPLNDSTFTSGMITGELAYNEGDGLIGNLEFMDIAFNKIQSNALSIKKMNLFAEGDKIELNSYLDIGNGGWAGNTQVIMDHIFSEKHHLSFSHGSDNGGTLWAEGYVDNNLTFKGTLDANGSWYIPKTISEITNTDLHADITADFRKGLKGITADIRSDSTRYQPPKMNLQLPIHVRGRLENGLLNIFEAGTRNSLGESINATIQFSLDSMKLQAIDVSSQQYTLNFDDQQLILKSINGHMEDGEDDLSITAEIPQISYVFNSEVYGHAEALAHGNIGFVIPHSREGLIQNNSITGNISIDKLVYYRDFSVEVTPSALDKYLTTFNNAIAKLRKKEVQETKLSTASPINLSVHVSDSQNDSVAIVTPFATFPFTLDVWVLGNTTRPLLRGDIANSNTGFIGVKDIYEFSLNSFQVSWNDVPWQNGVIDVNSSQDLPYCTETAENENETCPINLDIQGTITNPQPIPSSNCGMESSAAIYYNIFLGCIADDNGEQTDWNELAGKAIGKVISTTANKTLGGDYIGDIEMKVMLFESTAMNDKDSSFVKVPISLDRWVKNLSLVFGYTQDQSDNPTYDQALQFGVNYTLPFFQEAEFSHQNHISPTLSLNALLISKQYLTNTGTESNDNRLEKNIGINYVYRYWNPCLLGIGRCEEINVQQNQPEAKK